MSDYERISKRIHDLMARAKGTHSQEEARTAALAAVLLILEHGFTLQPPEPIPAQDESVFNFRKEVPSTDGDFEPIQRGKKR